MDYFSKLFKAKKPNIINQTAKNRGSNADPPPKLFKLNVDCFDEIFDFLTLNELQAFGQTCKAMQKVAGEYFKRNYLNAENFTEAQGIQTSYNERSDPIYRRTSTAIFNQFINYTSHYSSQREPLHYIKKHSHELMSLNRAYFVCFLLNRAVHHFQHLWPKIESLQIRQCSVDGDLYQVLLKFCTNLKKLYIQDDYGRILNGITNKWLLQVYPSLELFQFTPRTLFRIEELNTFLAINSSICTFSTTSHCLLNHAAEFLASKTQLDTLEILDGYYGPPVNMQTLCTLLNQLHERGFYKQLHLCVVESNQECGEQFASLKALESISVNQFSDKCRLDRLCNLKMLTISNNVNASDMETLAKNLVNLKSLSIGATIDDILPFFRWSVNLRKVHLHLDGHFLDVAKLSGERAKLENARKIMVYVSDYVFLETKWTTKNGDTDLKWVEMKRSTSQ